MVHIVALTNLKKTRLILYDIYINNESHMLPHEFKNTNDIPVPVPFIL